MDIQNVGGSPGGTKTFLLGLIMLVVGGYLLFHQVDIHGGYWRFGFLGGGGGSSFGITLIPLLFGIGILFSNGQSMVGRVLTAAGALVIIVGIIVNMDGVGWTACIETPPDAEIAPDHSLAHPSCDATR